jgi:rhodanese-related sulfurtransferase
MARIVELNRGPFLGAPPPLEETSPADATVLDVRPARTFAAGHVAGALNVPVSGSSFGTKVGFLLSAKERIVIHAETRAVAERAASRLRAVGLTEIAGYVVDPPQATVRLEPVTIGELEKLLAGGAAVVDVREHEERSQGYVAGTRHIPYRLLRACTDCLPRDRPVVTLCESGARAGIAASVLAAAGIDARPVLDAGIPDLESRGRTLVEFRRCGSP